MGHLRKRWGAANESLANPSFGKYLAERVQSFFGPLIDRTIDLLATFEAGEQAAIRRFLSGVRDAAGEG